MSLSIPTTSELRIREHLRELRTVYCYCIDERDWERFRPLFTEDVSLDYGELGSFEGSDGIEEFIQFVESTIGASSHMLSNPVFDIQDEQATGRWYILTTGTSMDGSSTISQGEYRDEYRRVGDTWKIDSITLRFHYRFEMNADGIVSLENRTEENAFQE
jgi:hypothetical protein